MRYEHVRTGPLHGILWIAAAGLAIALTAAPDRIAQLVLATATQLTATAAASFGRLTVPDEGDGLAIRCGPLPLFRGFVPFAEIESARIGHPSLLEGWGIHLAPGGGWVWNLWGRDCIDLAPTRGRRLRLGTDDPAGLLRCVHDAVAARDGRDPERMPSFDLPSEQRW
jgi:hypothetical protein